MKTSINHTSVRQRILWLFDPKVCYQLAASLLFTSFSIMGSAAWAKQYQPPTGDPPSGPIVSNGSRSNCGKQYDIPLTVLAPTHHVGQTTTTTPTLAWFIPATNPYRISLSLYTVNQELVKQLEYVETASGIVKFTLPEDEFELGSGQRYLWQVSIACTPDAYVYDQSFVSELEIKAPSASLATALSTAQTPLEKAELYASAGYWYDALREALIASENSETAEIAKSLLHELAESEGGIHGQFLLQIAETLNRSDPQLN